MPKMTSTLKELKEKGEKIVSIKCNDLLFYFKQPNIIEISYYQDQLYKSENIFRLREKFIRQMFIGENINEFDLFMKNKPLSHQYLYNLICSDLGEEINFTMAKV